MSGIGKQAKVMAPGEQRRLLSAAGRGRLPERDRVMVLLAVRAGLRAREVALLTWGMVLDPSGNVATVIDVRDGHRQAWFWPPRADAPAATASANRIATAAPRRPSACRRGDRSLAARRGLAAELGGELLHSSVPGSGPAGLLVTFRAAHLHHQGRSRRAPRRGQFARHANAGRASVYRNHPRMYRRRQRCAAPVGLAHLGQGTYHEQYL